MYYIYHIVVSEVHHIMCYKENTKWFITIQLFKWTKSRKLITLCIAEGAAHRNSHSSPVAFWNCPAALENSLLVFFRTYTFLSCDSAIAFFGLPLKRETLFPFMWRHHNYLKSLKSNEDVLQELNRKINYGTYRLIWTIQH